MQQIQHLSSRTEKSCRYSRRGRRRLRRYMEAKKTVQELNVFEVKRVESERLSIAKTSQNELFFH